jgi:hypothetical protein
LRGSDRFSVLVCSALVYTVSASFPLLAKDARNGAAVRFGAGGEPQIPRLRSE